MEEEKGLSGQMVAMPAYPYPNAYTLQSSTQIDTQEAVKTLMASANFEILSAFTKEGILKKLRKFQKTHNIINVSFSTDTKYSTTFEKEYTEYTVFVVYL